MQKLVRYLGARAGLSQYGAAASYAVHGPMKCLGDTAELETLCALLAPLPAAVA